MPKTVSIYIDDDLHEKASGSLKERGFRSFSEYANKLIKDNLAGTTNFSTQNKKPITDLYTTYRPNLAEETKAHLKKLPISEPQFLDKLLSALALWLEHYDPAEDSTQIRIADELTYVQNLDFAMRLGKKISQDTDLQKLVAEMPAPYNTNPKPKNERPKP